jgi:hypothetical protein
MPGSSPGMTRKVSPANCRAPPDRHFDTLVAQQGTHRRPYSLRPRVGRPSFSLPRPGGPGESTPDKMSRGWRTERRTSLPSCRVPVAENAGASRRAMAAISVPRVRVSWFPFRFGFCGRSASSPHRLVAPWPVRNLGGTVPSPAGSLRRGRSAPRSVPEASRVREERSSPAAGAAPCSVN